MQDRGGVILRAQGWNDDDGKGEGIRNRHSRRKITRFFASSLIWALLPLLRTGLILEALCGVSKVHKKMEGGGRGLWRRQIWSEIRMLSFALTCVRTVKHVRAYDCG